MTHVLDTNAVISLFADARGPVGRRLRTLPPGDAVVSSIVLFELYFGAFRSARPERNLARIAELRLPVIDLSAADALSAGQVRARLAASGTPIGAYDLLIAGQALARGLTVVTANRREFDRVEGLAVEDWSRL